MKTTLSTRGRIVLPAELRQQDQIEAGQVFDIERLRRGEYRLMRRSSLHQRMRVDPESCAPNFASTSCPTK